MITDALRLTRIDLRRSPRASVGAEALRALPRGGAVPDGAVRAGARSIIEAVRSGGSAAVRDANRRFGGGATDGSLVVGRAELAEATDRLPTALRAAIGAAAAAVRAFAETQLPRSSRVTTLPGVEIERRWIPLRRVGAYVPGGSAAYPSSVVMTVLPALVAGVDQIAVATPAGPDGRPDPVVAGTAGLFGVRELLVAGGAQAIAALAFGLGPDGSGFPGLERVDRIVGPGNAWVTAAKIELAGEVGIDLPAGPSEGMVIAGAEADPERVAADLLTQAEHGPDSPALLVTPSVELADRVETIVRMRLAGASRRAVLERSLGGHGRIVLVADVEAAIEVANAYGPEHLSIDIEPLEPTVAGIRNAGSVFVGPWAPESAGDYATGANHVLPTGGLARSSGALSVEAFGKFIQVQRITREGLAAMRPTIVALAEAEGLFAHRDAVEVRFR